MNPSYKWYRGFSTRSYAKTGKGFDLYNVELIEEDLLNEIFTLQGERVKLLNFGTRVELMVMEPNDQDSISVLREDVEKVIRNDPRVALEAIDVITNVDRHGIIIVAKVRYLEFAVTKDLYIEVNN